MALVVGTNSYISVEDAGSYFEDRFDSAAWTGADTATCEKALIAATTHVERLPLVGKKADEAQALQFPRCYATGVDFTCAQPNEATGLIEFALTGTLVGWPASSTTWECETEVPRSVLDAVCEEALALLAGKPLSKRAQLQREGVTSASIGGGVAETYTGAGVLRPLASPEANDLMQPYLAGPGGFG